MAAAGREFHVPRRLYICLRFYFLGLICLYLCVFLGLGCVTVMSAEAAAMHAAEVFALSDHIVWSKLRASRLNLWVGLRFADRKMQQRLEVDKKLL